MANTAVINTPTGVTPWTIPAITTTRPRLFFYPGTRLTRATNSWTSPPSSMTSLKSGWNTIPSSNTAYAIGQSLQYMLGGNNPTNLTNAYNVASAQTFSIPSSVSNILSCLMAPFVLDFCYAGLSTSQKSTLVGLCESFAQSAENSFTGSGSLDIANCITDEGVAIYVYCILAAEGESNFTSRITKLRNVLQNLQLWYDEYSAEGFRATYSYQVQFNMAAYSAYHIALGQESLLPSRVAYLAGQRDYLARRMNSTGQYYMAEMSDHRGDVNGNVFNAPPNPGWATAMFADVFQDSVHAWMTAQQLASQPNKWSAGGNQPITDATWLAFPFYNSGQTQQTPAQANLPLRINYPVSGVSNMRATWPNGTGCNAYFYAQPLNSDSHSTPYGGAIRIDRNSDVLIANGYNYAGRNSGWEVSPISTNPATRVGNFSMCKSSILFVPSGFADATRDGSQLTTYASSKPSGSSGTYPYSWALENNRGVGTFLNSTTPLFTDNFAGSPPETCTVGECTNAWNNTTQVSKHQRYFSDIPGIGGTGTTSQRTYVIRDHFTAAGGMSTVMVNFWCKTKPTISGQTVIQGVSAAGVIKCTGNSAVIVNGSSQATIQMVTPSPTTVFLVGGGNGKAGAPAGPGYESFFGFDPVTGLGGANLDFALNFQGGTGDSRNAPEYAWLQGQWCLYYVTDATTSGGEIAFVITVDASGTTAPSYTLLQAQTMAPLAFTNFNPTPPGPTPTVQVLQPAADLSEGRLMFVLKGANMNSTADQVFSNIGITPNGYAINGIFATNASTSLTTAAGGIWSELSQTGNNLVSSGQAYSTLTTSTKALSLTLASGATQNVNVDPPVLHLSTPQGSAATADFYVLGSDLSAVGAPQPPPPPVLNPNGAQWIAPTTATASTLETGEIVQITAWGGNEYGYAYTFSLSGAPPGVTIDADTGRLSIGSALSVNNYSFTITATNRENSANFNSFTFVLNVLAGIVGTPGTTTPSATQIAHFTYDPGSGTWGNPTGNDWTSVFNSMKTQILADQVRCNAVRDESMRADIPLQRGTTYQYTNNQWTNGIQYFNVHDAGTGALPIMQCTLSTNIPQNAGPLNLTPTAGQGPAPSSMVSGTIKAHSATVATVAAGATVLTLLNSGDASKLVAGRWHQVLGWVNQIGGFPPNEQFIDYVKVVSVVGTTVTIDRPLKYGYDQTWYENTSDDQSLGVGRICPFDTGGTGGYLPSTPRIIFRGAYTNINFLNDPNYTGGGTPVADRIIGGGTAIDLKFDGCQLPALQVTMVKHLYCVNCTSTMQFELDKQSETAIFKNLTSTGQIVQAATGYQYVLFLNSTCGATQISPRQMRSINSSFSAVGDPFPGVGGVVGPPITYAFQGPQQYYDFQSTTFTHGPNDVHWTPAYNSATNSYSLVIGTDATWSSNQLQIPSTFSNFEHWLIYTAPGTILSTNPAAPFSTNWGYVNTASSPGDGTALWLNVVWVNGVKPTSGTLWAIRIRRLNFASNNVLTSGTLWNNPGYAKQSTGGFGTTYDFPAGYPSPFNE